ncbi:MAG: hypothetical protein J7L54_00665, partial [Elusimicrobia bacterium]|nr:hypothetical protein [Elusimicrobiota bacterium]
MPLFFSILAVVIQAVFSAALLRAFEIPEPLVGFQNQTVVCDLRSDRIKEIVSSERGFKKISPSAFELKLPETPGVRFAEVSVKEDNSRYTLEIPLVTEKRRVHLFRFVSP